MLKGKNNIKHNLQTSIIKSVLVIGLCILSSGGKAQNSMAILIADEWMKEAKELSKNNEFIASDSLLVLARRVFENNKDWNNWFTSISRSNANAIKQRNYASFLESLLLLESITPKDSLYIKGRIIFFQAINHQYLGNIYESINLFKNSITLLDKVQLIYGHTRFYKIYYKKALKNIANGYSKYNDQVSALKYIQLFEKFIVTKTDTCNVLELKGRYLFYNGDNNKAYLALKKAIKNCDGHDAKKILGSLLIRMDSLEEASQIIKQLQENNIPSVDFHLASASLFKSKRAYSEAISHQQKALELIIADSYYGLRVIARESIILAQLYDDLGNLEEANKIAHKVLAEHDGQLTGNDANLRPTLNLEVPDIWIVEAHYIKAKYFRALYEKQPEKKFLEEAIFYYQALFDYLDLLKEEYYSSHSKYRMGAYGQEMYNDVIGFYIKLYTENNDLESLDAAFKMAQQSNSFVLKNAISERQFLQMIDLPQDSIDEYLSLVHRSSLEKDLNAVQTLNELDHFRQTLKSSNSLFKEFRNTSELSIQNVQALLSSDDLLLQYQYAENSINLFAISKWGSKAYKIKVPKDFKNRIQEHIEFVSNPKAWDQKTFKANGYLLYKTLLEDVLTSDVFNGLSNLYVIPNGVLNNISFSTLINNDVGPLNPKDYLVWDYSLSYLYFCDQLSQNQFSAKDKEGFIGFGLRYKDEFLEEIKSSINKEYISNGINSRSTTLDPLYYAVDEVKSCASVFDGLVYTDDQATVTTAFKEMRNHDLIHIAAHALIDKENYFNSHLILNKGDAVDYKLSYEDVIKLNIGAEFVILSACQTGHGDLIPGEGLMSLCRAFVQSGTKSVMGSYWNASDRSSSEIMSLFYTYLSQGNPKAKALQMTQKEFLTNDDLSSPQVRMPFYWASWAIFGENTPYLKKTKPYYKQLRIQLLAGLGMILFFLFLLGLTKRKVKMLKS